MTNGGGDDENDKQVEEEDLQKRWLCIQVKIVKVLYNIMYVCLCI